MYIARKTVNGSLKFFIRESYLEGGVYLFRDLMELSNHPADYIKYIQGRSFYIDEIVADSIMRNTDEPVDPDQLEEIFWPYIKPEIRRRFEFSRSKKVGGTKSDPRAGEIHIFDKRRLHYLRSGLMNQGRLDNAPEKMFYAVKGKSRDEIEQHFILEERILKPRELKTYVYVIFDLKRHFSRIFSQSMPQALDQKEMDKHFLNEICVLNRDMGFWTGMGKETFLREYLMRYVIYFFDYDFGENSFLEELLGRRIHERRYHRQMRRPRDQVLSEASIIFGVPEHKLRKMTKREITKIYRQKARESHPDSGGSHEDFVRLSNVYNELLERK